MIGANSDREYFQEPCSLSGYLTEQTCERCSTYSMLKLTRLLYAAEPHAACSNSTSGRTGGFPEFDVVGRDEPLVLRAAYWGGERDRIFHILFEGERIATQRLRASIPASSSGATTACPGDSRAARTGYASASSRNRATRPVRSSEAVCSAVRLPRDRSLPTDPRRAAAPARCGR